MTFMEDMHGHHATLMDKLDGREVFYTPQGAASRAVIGMFQAFSELVNGETVDVVVSSPVLSVRTADIPEIAVGDSFTIDGTEYEVAVIRPDSEGITELVLEAV